MNYKKAMCCLFKGNTIFNKQRPNVLFYFKITGIGRGYDLYLNDNGNSRLIDYDSLIEYGITGWELYV